MEPAAGQPRRSDRPSRPPLQKSQGTKTGKPEARGRKAGRAGRGTSEAWPTFQATPEQLAATQQYLQKLFQWVTTAILLLLAGSLTHAEILHPFTHKAGGGHKTPPITNTNRREDRGDNKVEIQPGKEDEKDTAREDCGSATGNRPTGDKTEPVPCRAVGVGCQNRVPSGFCHFRQHLCLVAPQPDRQCVPHGPLDGGHGAVEQANNLQAINPTVNGMRGRLRWENGFLDVWLGGEHYDLRGRAKARFCLEYLVAMQAFDQDSARHLEKEIDPFVRKKCQLPPASEIRIQHYFNDRCGKLARLRRELVKAAGRNGRFYLQVA